MGKFRKKRRKSVQKKQSAVTPELARIALWKSVTPWICAAFIAISLVLIVAFFVFAPKDRLDMCIEFVKNTRLPGILSFILMIGVGIYGAIRMLIGKNSDNTNQDDNLEV